MHRTPAQRAVTGLIASLFVLTVALGGGLASHLRTASATPPTPPFTQCPAVGLDTSCAVLIVFNPDGSRTTFVDPTQLPFDGIEDTLVGVQNDSGLPVSSLALTGPGIFGFDSDGLCAAFPQPAGCPYDTSTYAGRSSTTSTADTAAGCGNTFTVTDTITFSSGTVNWPLCGGIASGGSAYFSLEGPTSSVVPPTTPIVTFVTLSPVTAVNPVSTPTHTVTVLVQDQFMMPMSGVTVTFTVTRTPPPSPASGTCTTGTTGTCTFTYPGPILPAIDAITGCAAGAAGAPVCGFATKTWTLPVGTASCAIDITNGGWMNANNGDKVTFGGTVHTDQAAAPSGQEQYTDKPANLDVHSISILAVTCTANQEQADIYGTATINGSGSNLFRIEVTDPDSTSGSDTYWIVLDTGYDSGSHAIHGHVEMHTT